MSILLVNANAVNIPLANESVQCVVTSPPYYGLRDYGIVGQLGLERTPEEYVANLVAVIREVWRVMRDDGTLWLNLGDSYAGGSGCHSGGSEKQKSNSGATNSYIPAKSGEGLKPKDLIGIPWRVAFALRADGWYLRSDIIWHKPNPMPESVTDRPTKSHEYIFLLSKSDRYYYDAETIAESYSNNKPWGKIGNIEKDYRGGLLDKRFDYSNNGRNKRSVWTIATQPYSGAHFATFPPALIEPCVKAGSKKGDIILDPFAGSGTTMQVARKLERHSVGCDLSLSYLRECAIPRLQLNHDEFYNGKKASGIIEDLPLFSKMP